MSDLYKIDALHDLSGVKRYLRRKFSSAELDVMADEAFGKIDETVIIATNSNGGGVQSQVSVPDNLLLRAIEEIMAEGPGGRNIMVYPDYRTQVSRT